MKYKRRSDIIFDVVQFHASEPGDPLTFSETPDWLMQAFSDRKIFRADGDKINGGDYDFLLIKTLEGDMYAEPDSYIVKGVEGEIWAVKDTIFKATYEKVELDNA